MRLRMPLLAASVALLAWPAGAQSIVVEEEPEAPPRFAGRVSESPMPVRKAAIPVEEPEPVEGDADGDEGETRTAAAPSDRDDTGSATDLSRIDEGADTGTGTGTAEGADGDLSAGGRIKAVPDPESTDPDERGRRFVRAPAVGGKGKSVFDKIKEKVGAPIQAPETALQPGATLRQLDKMTGNIVTFDIAVGQTLKVARLLVKLDACRAPGENDNHGNMAFLKIWDTKVEGSPPSFTGWMFADSPALSALDHPRYDLWVINCTTPSGDTSAANE